MVYAGSIGMVFCIMMISLCHSFWQFLLSQGVLLGICMALATWPMVALVGQYFKRSRAAATGFVVAGSSLGGIVWPIVIDRLLNTTSIGFPWTMRIIGFIMIPCLIFSCVAAKSPETVSKSNYQEASETSDKQPTTEKDPKHDRNAARKVLYQQSSMQLTCLAMFLVYFIRDRPRVFHHFGLLHSLDRERRFILGQDPSRLRRRQVREVQLLYRRNNILGHHHPVLDKGDEYSWTGHLVSCVWLRIGRKFCRSRSILQRANATHTGHPVSPASLRCSACHSLHHRPRNRKRYRFHGIVISPPHLLPALMSLTVSAVRWPTCLSAARLLRNTDTSRSRSSPALQCLQAVHFWWLLVSSRTADGARSSEARTLVHVMLS
jgi:hypothetical protein